MSCNDWNSCLLGDVVTLKRGYDLPQNNRVLGNFSIISSSGITGTHKVAKVKGPGVVTGRSGLLGKVYYVDEDFWPLNTTLYVQDFHQNDIKFVYYFLQTLGFENYNAGSSVPTLNRNHIHSLPVKIPKVEEQKKISNILSSLDEKIHLNIEMNKTLEEISQTIFKHWFIDFEFPNEEDKPYKASDGNFVEIDFGLIPMGWEVKTIDKISNVTIGKTPPRKESQWFSKDSKDIKWASIKDMGDSGVYILNTSEYLTNEAVDKFNVKRIPDNTVILSFKLTVGRISITTEEMLTNEAIAHFTINNKDITTEYLYNYLKNFNFDILGSTSSIATAVNSKIVRTIPILIPPGNIIKEFQTKIEPIFKLIKNNILETNTLTKVRDILLSKLISGDIRINEGEQEVEACLQKSN